MNATVENPTETPVTHELLKEAGIQQGDQALWSISGWPFMKEAIVTEVTVKGIHLKNGKPAIEVVDNCGHGFRAYPKELKKA